MKSYDHFNFSRASVVQFQASRYIVGLNHTSESIVIAVWICLRLPFLILSSLIYYAPESNIWVKSYDNLSCSRASVVQFQASRYIICLNWTSVSKVMVVWICLVIPSLIPRISIYYAHKSHIRVKTYDHSSFSRAFIFQFQASRYIIGLNRTSESKVMAIWICLVFPCLIFRISLYYAPESNIWVKIYVQLNFWRASVVQLQASRYIIELIHMSESKVKAVCNCVALPYLISSILIYYVSESDFWAKCYDQLNSPRAFVDQFQACWYIIGLNRKTESKVMVVSISHALPCLI